MALFTKYKSKPTPAERDIMVKALAGLYEQLDLVDPESTKDWIKVAQLNESVTNQGYEYKDRFGKTEFDSAEKEAYFLDQERRAALAV